jgi:MFS family permease
VRLRLGRNVIALAAVSFFTDASSEMIYPLLPLFVTATLGPSAVFVGAIEGAADSVSALLKLASGWLSDRSKRRKPLVLAGYTLASAVRPLIAIAQ